jgi:hypothetical protein
MDQLELFEPTKEELKIEITNLKKELDNTRRGAFFQISELRKEFQMLYANVEVMSDELFKKEAVS